MEILFWILAVIVTNIVTALTIYRIVTNRFNHTVLPEAIKAVQVKTWSEAWDAGWSEAVNDPETVYEAWMKFKRITDKD